MLYKFAVIGTVGLPAKYGGWETLSEQLVTNLDEKYHISVYCSTKSYAVRPDKFNNADLIYLPLKANGIQSIAYDILSMIHAYRRNDVLLILGVSGCIALPILRLVTKKKLIVNIDGYEWKRAKWSSFAKKFLKFSEALAVKYSHAIVTDNKVLQDYVSSEYGRASTLIAYGGDQAITTELNDEDFTRYPFLLKPYAFSVCRIEPENNIHIILESFNFSGLPLVIVGNWKQSDYGIQLQQRYSDVEHLFLLDPIYDSSALSPLRSNCTIYIHGHSAGGTNPSLVEAMWLSLPIIAFDVDFNRASTEDKAVFFDSHESLTSQAQLLFENYIRRHKQGQDMHEIANRRYRWQGVSEQYHLLIQELLSPTEI